MPWWRSLPLPLPEVRASRIAQSATWATEVHTFWPLMRQPPSTFSARVCRAARSEPAPGSREHLAPHDLPVQGRSDEPLLLLGRAVGDDRRGGPAADDQVVAAHLRRGELLVDDQLLDGGGVAPPGRRPVRDQPAAVGDRDLALLRVGRAGRPGTRGPPRAARSCSPRSSSRSRRAPARARSAARAAPGRGFAEPGAQRQRPLERDVGVVLPGVADAAEHLQAVLGVVQGRLRQRRRRRSRRTGPRLRREARPAPGPRPRWSPGPARRGPASRRTCA